MPSERFYIHSPLKGHLILEDTEHHHLSHVMRVREGEIVELVNGCGELAQAKVVKISKKTTELEVIF
jgi:RsmE family RNA methyltransferase